MPRSELSGKPCEFTSNRFSTWAEYQAWVRENAAMKGGGEERDRLEDEAARREQPGIAAEDMHPPKESQIRQMPVHKSLQKNKPQNYKERVLARLDEEFGLDSIRAADHDKVG